MGRSENRNKSQATAAWLKEHMPNRLTSQCPICHKPYSVTGNRGLLEHFNKCGRRRVQ